MMNYSLIEFFKGTMRNSIFIGEGKLRVNSHRTKEVAEAMIDRLRDHNHNDYFSSDLELSKKYKLNPAMVKKIRVAAGIPSREDRIVRLLRTFPTETMYLDRISLEIQDRISKNSLYVVMRANKIPFLRRNKITRREGSLDED